MKAIVGIDVQKGYKPALSLLEKLEFPNLTVTLFHAAHVALAPTVDPVGHAHVEVEYSRVLQNLGLAALDEAATEASKHDLACRTKIKFGEARTCLIEEVQSQNAELVACSANHTADYGSVFFDSISRSLVTESPSSVLIAKEPVPDFRPLCVVFATDHSPYTDRCLEHFIEQGPKGISFIHLLSVFQVDDKEANLIHFNLPMLGGDADRWLQETTTANNERDSRKLRDAGYEVVSHVVQGNTNEVIRAVMEQTGADLLVVGSHGKGYIDRSFLGSTSTHQVACEAYNVLVLRP